MNVYVWAYLDKVSDNYHQGGGLIISARDESRARELATERGNIEIPETFKPDCTLTVDDVDEWVMVFPDAGCC